MNDQNICKFIPEGTSEKLSATNFIYETVVPQSNMEVTKLTNTVYIVSDGEGVYRCGELCWKLCCGMLFFSFADVPFVIENTDGLKYYYISFTGSRAEELMRRFSVTPTSCVFTGYEGLIPLWHDSLARADENNIDLLSESMVLYVFSKLKKAHSAAVDISSFVLGYMEKHFTEPDLSLDTVADAAGYHSKYISHIFKKRFGMGFVEYLRLMRIKHAVMLIENGVISVKNVALLSGFSDPLYFSKVFSKSMGMSPSEYMKSCWGREE